MFQRKAHESYMQQARRVAEQLIGLTGGAPLVVRLPDGSTVPAERHSKNPDFILNLKRPAALRRMFIPPSELAMGEGYIFDDFDIEGDIVAAFRFIDELQVRSPGLLNLARLIWQLYRLERLGSSLPSQEPATTSSFPRYAEQGQLHSPDRDRRAVQFHYDLSTEFYKLWLDRRMVYSCAYFSDLDDTLDQAQERKLDRICRKLDLQPGQRFLDIGCGFGGLMAHAASEYGVSATGISLSQAQTDEARMRFEHLGLGDRCQIYLRHYEQHETKRQYDNLASVGMFEHVGDQKLPGYFAKAFQLLRTGGQFLLQGGTARQDRRHAGPKWELRLGRGRNAFMQKYSFPDSRLTDISHILHTAEQAGFETRDVESLREHYPLTLRHWLRRLEKNRSAAVAEVGEAAFRAWRLVLAGYLHLLEKGKLAEYQILLSKTGPDGKSGQRLIRST